MEPIARPDARIIPGPGTTQSFDVLANDSDPDGDGTGLVVASAVRDAGEGEVTRTDSLVTITPNPDFVGDIVATAAKIIPVRGEGAWMDPGPLGTLGVGMPFAMAAKLAHPDRPVVRRGRCGSARSPPPGPSPR